MAFTGTSVIAEARILGNDTDSQDLPDANGIIFINEAGRLIIKVRPDLLIAVDGSLSIPTPLAAIGGAVAFPDEWQQAFVEWCLYRMYSGDARDQRDLRQASLHKKEFDRLLGIL